VIVGRAVEGCGCADDFVPRIEDEVGPEKLCADRVQSAVDECDAFVGRAT